MKAGGSRYERSEENDLQDDYDFITSQLRLASKKSEIRKSHWRLLIKNINGSYKSIANFIKWGKEEASPKVVLSKWKKIDNFYVFKFTEEDKSRQFDSENEWYNAEYRRQVGEPPEEDHDALMKRAINALKLQLPIDFNRILYRPPIQHELKLEQPSWEDTPLAITCTCATGDACSCFDCKTYLLPARSIPWKLPGNIFGIKMLCCLCCKSKGEFSSKFVKRVNKEGEYYRSPKGRKQLLAKGPEFCMSRCMQYMAATLKLDPKLAAELEKLQTRIDSAGLEGHDFGAGGEKFEIPDVVDTSRVCDAFTCSEGTQTENDPETGALLMGQYTHVIYGAPELTVMSDAEGTRLEISSVYVPPDPCVFNVNDMFCVEGIKYQMSRMKKLYSSSMGFDNSSGWKLPCVRKGSSIQEPKTSLLKKPAESIQSYDRIGSSDNNQETESDSSSEKVNDRVPQCDVCFPPLERLCQIKDSLKKYFAAKDEVPPYILPMNPMKSSLRTFTKESELQTIPEIISKEDLLENNNKKKVSLCTSNHVNETEPIQSIQTVNDIKSSIDIVKQSSEPIEEINKLEKKEIPKEDNVGLMNNESLTKERINAKTVLLDSDKNVINKNILDNQFIIEKDTITNKKRTRSFSLNEKEEEVSSIKLIEPDNKKSQCNNDDSEKKISGDVLKKLSRKVSKFSWKELFPSFLSRPESDKELKVTEYLQPNSNQCTATSLSNPESLTSRKQKCSRSLCCNKSANFVMKPTQSTTKNNEPSRSYEKRQSPGMKNISSAPNKTASMDKAKHNYRFYY